MSSFITRFLANMTMKESKTAPATEPRTRRHERSSKQPQQHYRTRHDYYRSSYIEDSDTDTDDEPLSENSLMLDLGPEYSPKTMSTISFPSPVMRGSTILFESEDLGESPQHVEVHKPAAAVTNSQVKRKPVQYYDAPAAQSEANYRQQRGRSSSRSSNASQERERTRRSSGSTGYNAGPQRWW
ncbi:hypothetical protein FRC12_023737 [Ceratobasidium sp. 428]|nr:hypothetical protein FRC12_023737 [Ceratobasidium sp. 428]